MKYLLYLLYPIVFYAERVMKFAQQGRWLPLSFIMALATYLTLVALYQTLKWIF